MDQRRAHGCVLSVRRSGDQARGGGGRTRVAPAGGAADRRGDWRNGRSGWHLPPDQQRGNCVAWLGDSDGNRYRLRPRRSGARRPSSPEWTQDLPGCPGHRG